MSQARIVAKEMKTNSLSTKVQEALRVQFESNKQEKKIISRKIKEATQSQKREFAILKTKQKHRGK